MLQTKINVYVLVNPTIQIHNCIFHFWSFKRAMKMTTFQVTLMYCACLFIILVFHSTFSSFIMNQLTEMCMLLSASCFMNSCTFVICHSHSTSMALIPVLFFFKGDMKMVMFQTASTYSKGTVYSHRGIGGHGCLKQGTSSNSQLSVPGHLTSLHGS